MFDLVKKFMLIMMAPDGGADGGSPADPAPAEPAADPATAATGTKPAEPAKQDPASAEPQKPALPKYSSQLSPSKRESEEYQKYLYKHQSLDELAEDHVALNQRLEKALELPGKDAKPEEIKAFLQKLGMPEEPGAYKLENSLSKDNPLYKTMEDEMRKQFFRSGLTNTQAQSMWNLITEGYQKALTYLDQQKVQQAQTFDARLAATLDKTYTVKSERDAAMKEVGNLFKQHVQRTGLGKLYKDSGLIYNPEFVIAMASEEKSRSGRSFIQGQPAGKEEQSYGEFGNEYHPSFKNEIKK